MPRTTLKVLQQSTWTWSWSWSRPTSFVYRFQKSCYVTWNGNPLSRRDLPISLTFCRYWEPSIISCHARLSLALHTVDCCRTSAYYLPRPWKPSADFHDLQTFCSLSVTAVCTRPCLVNAWKSFTANIPCKNCSTRLAVSFIPNLFSISLYLIIFVRYVIQMSPVSRPMFVQFHPTPLHLSTTKTCTSAFNSATTTELLSATWPANLGGWLLFTYKRFHLIVLGTGNHSMLSRGAYSTVFNTVIPITLFGFLLVSPTAGQSSPPTTTTYAVGVFSVPLFLL